MQDFLRKTISIFFNHKLRTLYYRSRRTKIHIQQNHLRPRIIFRKIQHNLRLRSPETINRLIIISHNKKIIFRFRKHFQNLILQKINILKLIHENVAKPLLPCGKNILPLSQKFIRTHEHIIKIQQAHLFVRLLITCEQHPKPFLRTRSRIIMSKVNLLIFHKADLCCKLRKQFLFFRWIEPIFS